MKYVMKAVNALIAAAIFPAAYFLELIFIQVGTNESAQPILKLFGSNSPGIGVEESLSINEIVQIAQGKHIYSSMFDSFSGSFTWPEALDPIKGKLIAFVVFFALCLLIALFVIVFSICSSKRLPVLIAGAAGLICAIAMISCFNSAADMLVSGEISISSVFGTNPDNWFSNLLLGFVGVDTLMLGGFHSAFIIIFVGIIVWTGAFALIEIGESKEPPVKKAKH